MTMMRAVTMCLRVDGPSDVLAHAHDHDDDNRTVVLVQTHGEADAQNNARAKTYVDDVQTIARVRLHATHAPSHPLTRPRTSLPQMRSQIASALKSCIDKWTTSTCHIVTLRTIPTA